MSSVFYLLALAFHGCNIISPIVKRIIKIIVFCLKEINWSDPEFGFLRCKWGTKKCWGLLLVLRPVPGQGLEHYLSDGYKGTPGPVGASMVSGKFVNALKFMNRMSGCIINAQQRKITRGFCGLCSKLCFHLRVEHSKYKLMIQAIVIIKPQHRQADNRGPKPICSWFDGERLPLKHFYLDRWTLANTFITSESFVYVKISKFPWFARPIYSSDRIWLMNFLIVTILRAQLFFIFK